MSATEPPISPQPRSRLTAADLAALPDEKSFELVHGSLVEQTMGAESAWIAGEVFARLREHVRAQRLGWVFGTEVGFQGFPADPGGVRKPDASFVRAGRLPGGRLPDGYVTVPPDLAVEVVSPHDLAYEIEEKIRLYLDAGVGLVWVIYPKPRVVLVYRPDRTIRELRGDEELSGEDVVPGFRCRVAELFPSPDNP